MLWWLIETTVVAALLALVAGMLARLQPTGVGPATRHALWLVVLVKLVTPPLVQSPWAVAVPAALTSQDVDRPAAVDVALEPEPVRVTLGHLDVAADPSPLEAHFARRLRPRLRNEPIGEGRTQVGPIVAPERIVVAKRVDPAAPPEAIATPRLAWPTREQANRLVLGLWLAATLGMATVQAVRLARFARRIRGGEAPPEWLDEVIDELAGRLGVRAPRALVVPGIGVPMLWCLGRPTLLLPAHLVETLGVGRWRGVIAHELAHLRRGDPWVGRLTLLAGIAWWWNPLYHLARRRVEAEAELACDAWVVSVLPGDRVVYAGTMLQICEVLATCRKAAPPLAPALGGGDGARGFFERRLTMILNDRVPCRLTWPGLIAPGLLVLAGLPTWTATGAIVVDDPPREGKITVKAVEVEPRIVVTPVKPGEARAVVVGGQGVKTQTRHMIVLTPGGTANVDGKVFVVTPDGKAQLDGKTITGKMVVDGKTIVVTPVEGAGKDGPIRILVADDDGKPVEVRGVRIEELKAKAEAARAEAMKHVEAVRGQARARVEEARARVDRAAEAVKRAKAELKEAEGTKDSKAAESADKALDKANAALQEAMARLKAAEAASQAAGRARVEVRTEMRHAGDGAAHAEAAARSEAKDDGDKDRARGERPQVRRRIEIRKHVGSDGKEQVEVRELPAEGEKGEARGDQGKDTTQRRIEVRVNPRGDDKGKARPKDDDDDDKEIEIKVRDLTKLFGPDSEFMKGLENLGPELEKSLREALGPGTEFDARMKDLGSKLGKELKENLGPGSAFDKAMKELSKALETQFGPGSDFEKQIKEFAREFEAHVQPRDKDGAKADKDRGEKARAPEARERPARERPDFETLRDRLRERPLRERPDVETARDRVEALRGRARDREIQALEARIKELQNQLEKARKAEKDKDKD